MRRLVTFVLLSPLAACAAPASPSTLAPVFCYRTLADVGCYVEPDEGRESRLTGIYAAPPDARYEFVRRNSRWR